LPENLAVHIKVGKHILNEREVYQYLLFYRLLNKGIHFYEKRDKMQVFSLRSWDNLTKTKAKLVFIHVAKTLSTSVIIQATFECNMCRFVYISGPAHCNVQDE